MVEESLRSILPEQTTSKESLGTSRAISRFFERFYCPTVMITRDRSLEQRAEGEIIKSLSTDDPAEDLVVLSSDLHSIKLKDGNSRFVSSALDVRDDSCEVLESFKNVVACENPKTVASEPDVYMTFDNRPETRGSNKDPNAPLEDDATPMELDDQGHSFVDLTADEPKETWKQTIIKRFCEEEDPKDSPAPKNLALDPFRDSRIRMSDNSSKVRRDVGKSGLATALKDRPSCVIPSQPNHCMPIRPIPPPPTRSSAAPKILVLKVNKFLSAGEDSSCPGPSSFGGERGFKFEEQGRKSVDVGEGPSESPNCSAKRKVNEMVDAEKTTVKDSRKRRKSQEANFAKPKEDRSKEILVENPRKHQNNVIVKNGAVSKEISQGSAAFSNDNSSEKEKEENKTVPPLRLKKILREATSEVESNYRIVTGATPVPFYSAIEMPETVFSWPATETGDDGSRRDSSGDCLAPQENTVHPSAPKDDWLKVKYRRNRLKQKLRDLNDQRQNLDEEIARTNEENSEQTIRLRQMVNCNEKQIENLSKLLNKLSSPNDRDVVEIEEATPVVEYETNGGNDKDEASKPETGLSERQFISPEYETISPDPPKLSPLHYEREESLGEIRDSPPLLARICMTIPPSPDNGFEKQLPSAEKNTWESSAQVPLSISLDFPEEEASGLATQTIDDVVAGEESVSVSNVSVIRSKDSNADHSEEVVIVNPVNVAKEPDDSQQALQTKQESVVKEVETISSAASFDVRSPEINPVDRSGQNETQAARSLSGDLNISMNQPDGRSEGSVSYGSIGSTAQQSQQVPSRSGTDQTTSYNPSANRSNVMIGEPADNCQNIMVPSHLCQPLTIDCSLTLSSFVRQNSDAKNNQRLNSNPEMSRSENILANNGNNGIITEQFPTLGNWVKSHNDENFRQLLPRVRHKQSEPNTSRTSGESMQVSGARKTPKTLGNVKTRNNEIGVKFRVGTERYQGYQDQHQMDQQMLQRQQLMLQQSAADSTYRPLSTKNLGPGTSTGLISSSIGPSVGSSIAPPTRSSSAMSTVTSTVPLLGTPTAVANPASYPRFCTPMSAVPFYPTTYPVDMYGNAAFSYHPQICTYQCHPQLHPNSLNGLHISVPETMQNMRPDSTRYYSTEMTKYSSLTNRAHANSNVADYERCRAMNTVRNNAGRNLLSSPSSLPSPTLPQSCIGGFSAHRGQYNRITTDMVAAAAAAAVAAAASIGQQQSSLSSYNRQERNRGTAIVDLTSEEPSHLAKNPSSNARERLSTVNVQPNVSGVINQNSRQIKNNAAYHSRQNLIDAQMSRIDIDRSYGRSSPYSREALATSSASSEASGFQSSILPSPEICPAPHFERIMRIPKVLSTIHCTNCGLLGATFKCLGCETTFYCNERCQTLNWSIHCQKCPKKMPKLKRVI